MPYWHIFLGKYLLSFFFFQNWIWCEFIKGNYTIAKLINGYLANAPRTDNCMQSTALPCRHLLISALSIYLFCCWCRCCCSIASLFLSSSFWKAANYLSGFYIFRLLFYIVFKSNDSMARFIYSFNNFNWVYHYVWFLHLVYCFLLSVS